MPSKSTAIFLLGFWQNPASDSALRYLLISSPFAQKCSLLLREQLSVNLIGLQLAPEFSHLTHLFYADDIMLFAAASELWKKGILTEFCSVSGPQLLQKQDSTRILTLYLLG